MLNKICLVLAGVLRVHACVCVCYAISIKDMSYTLTYMYYMSMPCITVHVAGQEDRDEPGYVEALEKETSILEKRVEACRSRIMLVTCFDISVWRHLLPLITSIYLYMYMHHLTFRASFFIKPNKYFTKFFSQKEKGTRRKLYNILHT